MNKFFKSCIAKAYKTGYFIRFEIKPGYLSFEDVHGVKYVIQKDPCKFGYWFRIGRVETWTERGPTFESEYNSMGDIHKARFVDFYALAHTDNPDFIFRASVNSFMGNKFAV